MADNRRIETLRELRPYIERARPFSGWDFGRLEVRPLEPDPPWDYEELARRYARQAEWVLDMGTGGGEVLSRIAAGLPARFVATESWEVNVPVARDRLAPVGVDVIRCPSLHLALRDAAFDLILNRHEELDPAEIVRLLRRGGRLATQQVGRKQLDELRRHFPRMRDFGDVLGDWARAFASAGLFVHAQEHARRVAFVSLGDLVFLLLVTPWSIPGFDPEGEIDALMAVEDEFRSEHGIILTEDRFLIVAQKNGQAEGH